MKSLDCMPMPIDVVDALHRLAAASKQAGGITFTNKDGNIITNKDGNIITNNNDKETEEVMENDEPLPVQDDNHKNIINNDTEETDEEAITRVDEQSTEDTYDNTPSTRQSR